MSILWISPEDTIEPDGVYTQSAIEAACFILYKLTAEKYTGIKTVTEEYNLQSAGGISTTPSLIQGGMFNLTGSSNGIRNLRLRHQPVLSVSKVVYLGKEMNPSSYTLRNNSYLVQKNSLPWILNDINDISITYTYGLNPPSAGIRAAIRLANELILADSGSSDCSLPERITSVSRQGVSYTVMDPQEFLANGRVGLYEVDLFLTAVNPIKAKKRPKIFSVDQPRGERIT